MLALATALTLLPAGIATLPQAPAYAVPTVTLHEQVDCSTGFNGPAVVFTVDGREDGQHYWMRSTAPDGQVRTTPAEARYQQEGGVPVESGEWHGYVGSGPLTVEVMLGDWEGPTGTPLASSTYVADCTFLPFPNHPGFADGEWEVPADDEHLTWTVNDGGELVVSTTGPTNVLTPALLEEGTSGGWHLATTSSLSYGTAPVSAAGSAHFTGVVAGESWTAPPCRISMGGGGAWPGYVLSYWGTDDVTVSAAGRDGQFLERFTGDPGHYRTPEGVYRPALVSFYGSEQWWDPAQGPYTLRATDNATGEVIGQRTFTEHCGVVYDPIDLAGIDVPATPEVGADGSWVVPESDETFQWVVLMDGTLQVRVLPAWSTFPDGEVVHNYGLPTTDDGVPTVARSYGDNRFGTAAQLAVQNFEPGLDTVYLATGWDYPDALAGAALAGHDGAPILLTNQHTLPSATATALSTLRPAQVVVLGGATVISDPVLEAVAALGIDVRRVAGSNRYQTAVEVSALLPGSDTVYVATGTAFPDALAAGALAGQQGAPILLTRPGALPEAVAAELSRRDPARVIVLGGSTAVSEDVVDQIETLGLPVTRIAGANRFETAARVAELRETGAETAWVATGYTFADALAAAPVAAHQNGPVLLTRTAGLPAATGTALVALSPREIHVLGGEAAVAPTVIGQIRDLPWAP